MKILYKIPALIFFGSILIFISSCQKEITDYGFDAAISGKVVDQSGNIVPGDITSTNLSIKALGDGDKVTIDMRVKGDGTYKNNKIFPKKFRVWVTGPVTTVDDTLRIDFGTNMVVEYDFVVIPFVSIDIPAIVGTPTSTSLGISYNITANNGKTISKREIYCSTVPYPNASTGSGAFYQTVKATLSTNSGTVNITGLTANTSYFLRIGAQATGATGMNYSEQITFTTPAN